MDILGWESWCWVALQPLMMPRAKGEWQCWFWIRTCILNKSHWHHDVLHQMDMNEPERSSQGIDGNRLSHSANCFLESMCLMFVHNMLWNVHMQFITTPLATIPKSDIRSEPRAITSSPLAFPKVPYNTEPCDWGFKICTKREIFKHIPDEVNTGPSKPGPTFWQFLWFPNSLKGEG